MSNQLTWAIIGGGHGGQTFAGHLALLGQKVRLYSDTPSKVQAINQTKEIVMHHALEGIGQIEFATGDMKTALNGADNIVIVLPSIYHEKIAEKMIPFLQDGQNVLLLPEASCGAISFRKKMKDMNCNAKIVLGAACTLPYATRCHNNGEVFVFGLKKEVKIAALPAADNAKLEKAFCAFFPYFKMCNSVLETSIDNINAMMHPAAVFLNTSRIEAVPPQQYEYYREGITPSIGVFIEKMDEERIAIAQAFGFEQRTLRKTYIDMYECGDENMPFEQLIRNNKGYEGIMNAKSLRERYVLEDIPFSLVAISALGQIVGVPTPCIDAIITIGKAILGADLQDGRTAANLGIEGMSTETFERMIFGN